MSVMNPLIIGGGHLVWAQNGTNGSAKSILKIGST